MKLIWNSEEPTEDGLYWFDSNLRIFAEPDERHPMLLTVHGDSKYVNGKGSCPLSNVYNAKLYKQKSIQASFAVISKPSDFPKWKDLHCIKKSDTCAWFRSSEGYMGVGINLRPESHAGSGYSVFGDFIWLDHPTQGAEYSAVVHERESYEYVIIDVPMVGIKKAERK